MEHKYQIVPCPGQKIHKVALASVPVARVALISVFWLCLVYGAQAQTINVAPGAVEVNPGDGICSLREAIENVHANNDLSGGDCDVGFIIELAPDAIYTIPDAPAAYEADGPNGLPTVSCTVVIRGNGAVIEREAIEYVRTTPPLRILRVSEEGELTLNDVTIRNGRGGRPGGGGILNYGAVTLVNTIVERQNSRHPGSGILNRGTMQIVESVVRDNFGPATSAGGIQNSGRLDIIRSTVSGNGATFGGGGIANGGTLVIENSTISRNGVSGLAEGSDGGGIVNAGTLTVKESAITGNYGMFVGGGVINRGMATFENTIINDNDTDGEAGGIQNTAGETIIIGGTVHGNRSLEGGAGISVINGKVSLINTTISGNRSEDFMDGGGIQVIERLTGHVAELEVRNSTVSGNIAGSGSGLSLRRGSAVVTNSTFSGNAFGRGAAMSIEEGSVTITNTTITDNHPSRNGAALQLDRGGLVRYRNSIIAGNETDCIKSEIGGTFESLGFNLVGAESECAADGPGDIVMTTEEFTTAVLGPLDDHGGPTHVHALVASSPAIDAGTCTDFEGNPITEDQRGEPRPSGVTCDIGAFEFQGEVAVDKTAPECGLVDLEKDAGGRLTAVSTAVSDPESGIASIEFVTLQNLTASLDGSGNYRQDDVEVFDAQETGTVTIRAEHIDLAREGVIVFEVTNGVGLTSLCAPVVASVSAELADTPDAFELGQNYPNPFNPATTIQIKLPEHSVVTLTVYDMLGRQLVRLIDETKAPGVYALEWDGRDDAGRPVPSGRYIYWLEAGTFTEARTMTLLK